MAEEYRYYLTTRDNPFDPEEQQAAWRLFDKLNHYDTEEMLDNWTTTSDDLEDEEKELDTGEAMLRIIARDPNDRYIRIRKPIKSDVENEE